MQKCLYSYWIWGHNQCVAAEIIEVGFGIISRLMEATHQPVKQEIWSGIWIGVRTGIGIGIEIPIDSDLGIPTDISHCHNPGDLKRHLLLHVPIGHASQCAYHTLQPLDWLLELRTRVQDSVRHWGRW